METYCLKWNSFQTNISKSIIDLRREEDFFDVTLVTDDQQFISAHKLVLSSSSELFNKVDSTNRCEASKEVMSLNYV